MQGHVFLALSRPSVGREEEFHRWYDAHHLQDVVDLCPGFVAGHRYFAIHEREVAEWPSLAIYRLESDDLALLHSQVATRTGEFTPSGGVFAPDHAAWVYSASVADTPALVAWTERDESKTVVLAFYDAADAARAALDLPDVDASPLLTRGDGQREGEMPAWRHLIMLRSPAPVAGSELGEAAAHWTFAPRGTRVHTKPR